jgi:hypothetical protein
MNDILRNNIGYSKFFDSNLPYISGVLDLQLIRNIYFHSPNLSNFNTIGPLSESSIIKKAYEQDYNERFNDDASVAELAGERIHLVDGNSENIKITYPSDIKIANALLKKLSKNYNK